MGIDERGLQAAMDAFEPLSSVLRYRGRNANGESNWHTCDRMALRHALEAYEAAKPAAEGAVDFNLIARRMQRAGTPGTEEELEHALRDALARGQP